MCLCANIIQDFIVCVKLNKKTLTMFDAGMWIKGGDDPAHVEHRKGLDNCLFCTCCDQFFEYLWHGVCNLSQYSAVEFNTLFLEVAHKHTV